MPKIPRTNDRRERQFYEESVASESLGLVPRGIIAMWSGTLATVPASWSLCDGTNGTPDLRDKFIYGWTNGVDPGGTGGAATHTHSIGSHTHGAGTLAGGTTGSSQTGVAGTFLADAGGSQLPGTAGHTHTGGSVTGSTDGSSGNTGEGSTLPPYYKLAFIMKL